MIFEKKGMWKSSHGALKFATRKEASDWELQHGHTGSVVPSISEKELNTDGWTPLEKLRGIKDELDEYEDNLDNCEDCGCDPCECD